MRDILVMLSSAIQSYYETEYDSYQAAKVFGDEKNSVEREAIARELYSCLPDNSMIVDIGSGSCQWLGVITDKVSRYIAIEPSTELTKRAASKFPDKLLAINVNAFEIAAYADYLRETSIILLSFFLSHFSDESINELLSSLRTYSKPIVIIDSIKSPGSEKNSDLQVIKRKTSTGFIEMPKRYFPENGIAEFALSNGFTSSFPVKGAYWFLCILSPV